MFQAKHGVELRLAQYLLIKVTFVLTELAKSWILLFPSCFMFTYNISFFDIFFPELYFLTVGGFFWLWVLPSIFFSNMAFPTILVITVSFLALLRRPEEEELGRERTYPASLLSAAFCTVATPLHPLARLEEWLTAGCQWSCMLSLSFYNVCLPTPSCFVSRIFIFPEERPFGAVVSSAMPDIVRPCSKDYNHQGALRLGEQQLGEGGRKNYKKTEIMWATLTAMQPSTT